MNAGGGRDSPPRDDDPIAGGRKRRKAILTDYDRDPERFRLARAVLQRFGSRDDVHGLVARRLLAERLVPILDVGCGEGELATHLPSGVWVGLDSSREMLARSPEPKVQAEATALPFRRDSFGSVALLYVLYHVPEPLAALVEAHRVMTRGGLIAIAAPSRFDSPELAAAVPRAPVSFDAELSRSLLEEVFTEVEVERWDARLLELPSRAAVRDYLIGKGVEPATAESEAEKVSVPLSVTKRGALAFARKP
jgi:SAM-dependent methyltransferase